MFRFAVALMLVGGAIAAPFKERFEEWIQEFRIVVNNQDHKDNMFKTWIENDKIIEETNSRNLTYSLGHNQFSGMSPDEFSDFMRFESNKEHIGLNINVDKIKERVNEIKCLTQCVKAYDEHNKLSTISCVKGCLDEDTLLTSGPDSINWVDLGAVTSVKNQGQCGSCWSFSTTGALEGAYFVTYGDLPSFSEQQLVDCDTRSNGGKDMGCNGGLMDNAFKWIEKNGGLCTEEEYPYTSGTTRKSGTCDNSCEIYPNSKVSGIVDVRQGDSYMMDALKKQPVSIAIQADQQAFQLYKSGVFTGSCGTNLDHGVLAVGYGNDKGQDYYLVKNSWGTTWGDKGYIKLGRGDEFNKGKGQCGMLMQPSYPQL